MREDPVHIHASPVVQRGTTTSPEGRAMYLLEHDLAQSRMREDQAQAEAASRARRLYLARRAARRAERAVQRAARASAAVY
jgi:hypothetical protein